MGITIYHGIQDTPLRQLFTDEPDGVITIAAITTTTTTTMARRTIQCTCIQETMAVAAVAAVATRVHTIPLLVAVTVASVDAVTLEACILP